MPKPAAACCLAPPLATVEDDHDHIDDDVDNDDDGDNGPQSDTRLHRLSFMSAHAHRGRPPAALLTIMIMIMIYIMTMNIRIGHDKNYNASILSMTPLKRAFIAFSAKKVKCSYYFSLIRIQFTSLIGA